MFSFAQASFIEDDLFLELHNLLMNHRAGNQALHFNSLGIVSRIYNNIDHDINAKQQPFLIFKNITLISKSKLPNSSLIENVLMKMTLRIFFQLS